MANNIGSINQKGRHFYLRRKKDLFKYFYIAPIFIMVTSFLFVLGAKNNFHLYFSFFLILFQSLIFIIAMLSFTKNLNRTISFININAEDIIKIKTFKVLFLKSIIAEVKKKEVKLLPRKFQINKKEKEEGWIIRLNNNKQLYLYKDFFEQDIIDIITKNF